MRQKERLVNVDGRRGKDVFDVDALVDGDGPLRRDAVRHQHLSDGLGRRDEAVDLPMLPARERITAQVEVDAPGHDERGGLRGRPAE